MNTKKHCQLMMKAVFLAVIFSLSSLANSVTKQGNGAPFWADGKWNSYYEEKRDSKSYMKTGKNGWFTLKHHKDAKVAIGAKGWLKGNYNRTVRFKVRELTTGGKYLVSVYGWFKDYPEHKNNGIVEYYVVEHNRGWKASEQQDSRYLGRHWVNGGWYKYYVSWRYNEDHAFGNGKATFKQYWAIRESKRWNGTVTMSSHFYNWSRHGQKAKDQWGYQMLGIESFRSTGKAVARVW